MEYLKFTVAPQLQPFVECYYVWQSNESTAEVVDVESPPSGFVSMVFNTGNSYTVSSRSYGLRAVPPSFVCGQLLFSYSLRLIPPFCMSGIVFKPAGLASLLHLPVEQYVEDRLDLQLIFPADTVRQLQQQLLSSYSASEKARNLERFLVTLAGRIPEPDGIDHAANEIVRCNGMLHIHELAKASFMSRRSFERKFFKRVGLSPKYYARIRRISYISNLIAGRAVVDWADLFYKCEYYDRSHFTKDFLEFTGRTPQQYLAENRELARFIAKPREESFD